jgi:hypothetical protein
MIKYMDWVLENIDGEIPQPENKNIGFITTTPKVIPKKCPNDAPDETYPYCCHNGAKNKFCCTGPYINPTCSAPTTTPRPTTWNQIISEAEPESEAVIAAKRVYKYYSELLDSVIQCNPQSVYKSFYSLYPKYIYIF